MKWCNVSQDYWFPIRVLHRPFWKWCLLSLEQSGTYSKQFRADNWHFASHQGRKPPVLPQLVDCILHHCLVNAFVIVLQVEIASPTSQKRLRQLQLLLRNRKKRIYWLFKQRTHCFTAHSDSHSPELPQMILTVRAEYHNSWQPKTFVWATCPTLFSPVALTFLK